MAWLEAFSANSLLNSCSHGRGRWIIGNGTTTANSRSTRKIRRRRSRSRRNSNVDVLEHQGLAWLPIVLRAGVYLESSFADSTECAFNILFDVIVAQIWVRSIEFLCVLLVLVNYSLVFRRTKQTCERAASVGHLAHK